MKKTLITFICLITVALTGCSQKKTDLSDIPEEKMPQQEKTTKKKTHFSDIANQVTEASTMLKVNGKGYSGELWTKDDRIAITFKEGAIFSMNFYYEKGAKLMHIDGDSKMQTFYYENGKKMAEITRDKKTFFDSKGEQLDPKSVAQKQPKEMEAVFSEYQKLTSSYSQEISSLGITK